MPLSFPAVLIVLAIPVLAILVPVFAVLSILVLIILVSLCIHLGELHRLSDRTARNNMTDGEFEHFVQRRLRRAVQRVHHSVECSRKVSTTEWSVHELAVVVAPAAVGGESKRREVAVVDGVYASDDGVALWLMQAGSAAIDTCERERVSCVAVRKEDDDADAYLSELESVGGPCSPCSPRCSSSCSSWPSTRRRHHSLAILVGLVVFVVLAIVALAAIIVPSYSPSPGHSHAVLIVLVILAVIPPSSSSSPLAGRPARLPNGLERLSWSSTRMDNTPPYRNGEVGR
ncbi:hypothetical protein EW146_g9378 [Bondarzewia mesenterica]|uniref:Uncharacterized protein n=1 Tax=Bondarzewia mesenterica TaxID=1095465 RepID=A0A4S4L8R5_9AGAM|nr:hypothetical protein EW146_g9378 [Bondarzewia mesenterica]